MIRKFARPLTSRAGEFFLAPKRKCAAQGYGHGIVTVVSPAAYGSLGDEALLGGSLAVNEAAGYRTTVWSPGDATRWPEHLGRVDSIDGAVHPLGFHWRYSELPRSGRMLVILGADSIDGLYGVRSITARVRLANDHVAGGGEAHFANFSLRSEIAPGIRRILRHLDSSVTLSARDELSQSRAADLFEREVLIAPDIAQFLKPQKSNATTRTIESLRGAREKGRPVVTLVPNAHFGALYGNSDRYAQGLITVMRELTKAGAFVCVLTHDRRESPGDESLAKAVYSEVRGGRGVTSLHLARTAAEAKTVLSEADLVVSGRMHAAVAALSSSVPTIGLDYADKFVGQFKWYDAEHLVVDRGQLLEPLELHRFIVHAISSSERPNAAGALEKLPTWLDHGSNR